MLVAAADSFPGSCIGSDAFTIVSSARVNRVNLHASIILSGDTSKLIGGRYIAAILTFDIAIAGGYTLMSTVRFKDIRYRTNRDRRALQCRNDTSTSEVHSNGRAMT